ETFEAIGRVANVRHESSQIGFRDAEVKFESRVLAAREVESSRPAESAGSEDAANVIEAELVPDPIDVSLQPLQPVLSPAKWSTGELKMQIVRAAVSFQIDGAINMGGWWGIELVGRDCFRGRFSNGTGDGVRVEVAEGIAEVNFLSRKIDRNPRR